MSFNNEIKKYFFYGVSILFLFFISSLAYAGSSIFPVGPEDASINVIKYLFGSILPSGLSGGADPFGKTIEAFNTAVLTIGGILAGYTMLVGTVNTAHDGEMLGKKFSSAWVPFRTAVGTMLVLPVFSGYCLMQVLVMWLVVQGIGMANLTWTAFLGSSFTSSSYGTVVASPKVNDLVQKAYMSMICAKAYEKVALENPESQNSIGTSWGYTKVGGTYLIGNNSNPSEASACGIIKPSKDIAISKPINTSGDLNVSTIGKSAYGTPTIGSSLTKDTGQYSAIATAHATATATMMQSVSALAVKTVAGNPIGTNDLTAIAQAYETTIAASVKSQLAVAKNPFENAQAAAAKEGWMMAGSWFMKLVNTTKEVKTITANAPTILGTPKLLTNSSATSQQVNTYLLAGQKNINNDTENSKSGLQKTVDDADDNDWGGKFGEILGQLFTGIDISSLSTDTRHPILIMSDMGERLLIAVPIAVAIIIAIYSKFGVVLGNLLGKAGGGDTVVGAVSGFLSLLLVPILLSLLGMGFTLAFFIPMLPFTIWIGALIGWLILVVEAVIAAPLWAVMHLHPSGEDVTGRGGNGYTIVLSLVLKPVLMIFGLAAAIILAEVFGTFINKVFYNTMFIAMDEGEMGFWSTFFGLVIYIGIMLSFVKKTFDIIHIIPDQLLRWIGGGGPGLGESAGKMAQGTEGKAAAVGGFIGSQAGSGFNTGIQRAQGYKANKLQEENNKKQNDMANGEGATDAREKYVQNNSGLLGGRRSASAASFDNGINIAQSIGGKEGAAEYISQMNAGGDRDQVLSNLHDKYLADNDPNNTANVANVMKFSNDEAGVVGAYSTPVAAKLADFKNNYTGAAYTSGLETINTYVNDKLRNSDMTPAQKQTALLGAIGNVMKDNQHQRNDVIASTSTAQNSAQATAAALASIINTQPVTTSAASSIIKEDDQKVVKD